MKRRAARWFVPLLAAGLLAVGVLTLPRLVSTGRGGARGAPLARFGDRVCGPRCARYVLHHYGVEEDLATLVRETQWPDFESGASLASLAEALEKRGVHTCALRLSSSARLCWPHPVIVHLRGVAGQMDHFVLWKPADEDGGEGVYFEPGDLSHLTGATIARGRSGVVLLTSPEPIANPERAAVEAAAGWYVHVAVAAGTFVAAWVAARLFSRWWFCTGGPHEAAGFWRRRRPGGLGLARSDPHPAPEPR
jgi:hypothetical protein